MLTNDAMSPLFEAVIKATEEAIYNSMFKATTTTGNDSFRGNRRMSRLSSSFVTRPNVAQRDVRTGAFDYSPHLLFGTPVPVMGTWIAPPLVAMFSVADSDASSEGLNLTAMVQCLPAARVGWQYSS